MRGKRHPKRKSFLRQIVERLLWRGEAAEFDGGGRAPRRLRFEPLEGRQLLASDLASLTGIVSLNTPVPGATIELFRDVDNDNVFEPGGDDLTAEQTDVTDGAGAYRFDGLTAGNYFLRQPSQTIGATDLGEFVSAQINVTALQAEGIAGLVVDDFNDAVAQLVTATDGTPTASGTADHAGALGGERDMSVALLSGTPPASFAVESSAGSLEFNSSLSGQGRFTLVYDGNDNDAGNIAFTGLGAQDLTQGGATALQIRAQADQAGATVIVRVYTDATNFSETTALLIPGTNTPTDFVLDFDDDFTQGGTATGPADFANVGAIEVIVETTTDGTDGLVTLLGAFGPTVITQDVTNEADLSLTKSVDNATPNFGDDVTYTVTVTNAGGGAGATNIAISDAIPTGMTIVTVTPDIGNYDQGTDVWTIDELAAGGSATLTIVATVNATGSLVNTAEITAADQPDPDSTPGNANAAEDDQDSETITVAAAADLSVTKTVDDDAPNPNQVVTFTILVTNDGPDQATGVQLTDVLPAGLTFDNASATLGSYDNGTGVWTIGTLNDGESATLTLSAEVTSNDPITNTATITASDQFDPNANNDSASDTLDVPPIIDLELDKSVNDATPNFGETITFTITLDNVGPEAATGVVVTDLLPAGLTFDGFTATQGTYDETTGEWDIGAVAAGATLTLTIDAIVNATGTIVNTAEVTECGGIDDSPPGDGAGDDFDTQQIDVPLSVDLAIDKTIDDTTPAVGQDVVFTLTLTNNGPDDATGVAVTDLLPAGLTFVSASPAADYDSGTGVWTIGVLASGASEVLTITATVENSSALTNTATISAADQPDPNENNDTDSVTVDVPDADLSIEKTIDDATPTVGQDVVFTLTITNNGPDAATGVVVTDQLPAGLTFVSANPAADYNSTTGVWTVGDLASGASEVLTITATVENSSALTNTATITASDVFDDDATDNTDSVTVDVPDADLAIDKVADDTTPNVGQNVVFTLTITNTGPDAATGVVVTDQLPAGLTFVSANPAADYNSATGVWTVGSLASGASEVLTITATVGNADALTNTATITASEAFDDDAANNTDSVTVNAVEADLSIDKTIDDTTPNVGQNVVFTLTINNTGPDAAGGVTVTDLLPAGLTFVSASPAADYNSATGVWTVGSLASGASEVLTITATVTSAAAITNTATITASDAFDPDTADNTDSLTIDAPAADLSLQKTVDNATPNFGSNVTFTVTLTNNGTDTATNVVVTDALPSGLVFVSSNPATGTTYNSTNGQWSVPTLASGQSVVLTLVARVNSTAAITNVAEVTASGVFDPDSTPNNGNTQEDDRATAVVDAPAAADLRLAKTVDDNTANPGQQVVFTLTLRNDGPDTATAVSVLDQLPAGLTFVTSTGSQGTYNNSTGVWTVGDLASGATATLTITATYTGGSLTNTAQVSASGAFDPDSTPNNNVASEDDQASVTVGPNALSKRRFLAR